MGAQGGREGQSRLPFHLLPLIPHPDVGCEGPRSVILRHTKPGLAVDVDL